MQRPDCEQLTLSQADFHVNHFPWLESKKVKGTNATYGRKCSELSESLRRVGYLVRTYLESSNLPGEQYARTWSVRDTLSPFLIMKLRLSERYTDGNGSLLWRTPSATLGEKGGPNQRDSSGRPGLQSAAMLWPTPTTPNGGRSVKHVTDWRSDKTAYHNGKKVQVDLNAAVRMWPTPSVGDTTGGGQAKQAYMAVNKIPRPSGNHIQLKLRDCVKLWPTPTTGAGLCGGTGNFKQLHNLKDQGVISEEERRNMSQGSGGQLNPEFVEYLMNFPRGWTQLD